MLRVSGGECVTEGTLIARAVGVDMFDGLANIALEVEGGWVRHG